jgi:hypothetical protein
MIITFTPNQSTTENKILIDPLANLPELLGPSDSTINNILNYSKSLEIKPSNFIGSFEVLKS